MCKGKRLFFHHRRHGHGCRRSMKRHGERPHHGKHFDGPSKHCRRGGSPHEQQHERIDGKHFDGPSKFCQRGGSPYKGHHERNHNHCMFGRKNHHSIPQHDFGSPCEMSGSPNHHGHHEHHRFRHRGPHHHHHGRKHFGRRNSAEF